MGMSDINEDEAAFRGLFECAYGDVVRYVGRRTTDDREDLAAEALAIAWRRWPEVPTDPVEARAYVFGIARRLILASQSRSARRAALAVRLAGHPAQSAVQGHEDEVLALVDLRQAWSQLEAAHQEVLALSILEDLPSAAAGRALGISAVAYRIRLSRARAALLTLLGDEPTTLTSPLLLRGRS